MTTMMTMTAEQAMTEALAEEMRNDATVITFGEGVATKHYALAQEFGAKRVRNTPLAEGIIAGTAAGAAATGLRPVIDLLFAPFLTFAMEEIVNSAGKLRYISGGQFKFPMVTVTRTGAGWAVGAQHNHNNEAWFVHTPGVKASAEMRRTGDSGVDAPVSLEGPRTEMRGLQWISDQINRAENLENLIDTVLAALETYFGFTHSMLLLHEEGNRLVTVASRGYGESGVGAEVAIGEGLIGTVARERRLLRMTGLKAGLDYGRAARRQAERSGRPVTPEIPLPGLADAQSALIIPLWVAERLIGVLSVESHDSLGFAEWHEAYLEIIGNQIALGIERELRRSHETEDDPAVQIPSAPIASCGSTRRSVFRSSETTWKAG
jgi:hypothetical protein